MTRLCLTLVAAFVCGYVHAADSLEARIKPIVEAHKGKVAVMVKNLETGESYGLNADTVMPTASLIKLAVMVETYQQAEEKKVDLAKMLTLKKDDRVPGSGILTTHFSDGLQLSLRDAVRLMIAYSDNTATNLVIDQIGLKCVSERMKGLGFSETRLNAKVYKPETRIDQERGKLYGLGTTTAVETVGLLELIHANKVVSFDACQAMLGHLKANEDKDQMVRFLPPGTVVAHKTGAVNASRTDAGIIYLPGFSDKKKTIPIALCVLTNENKDQRWVLDNEAQVTIAKIGKEVYEYYLPKK